MELRFRFHIKTETQSHDHATIDCMHKNYRIETESNYRSTCEASPSMHPLHLTTPHAMKSDLKLKVIVPLLRCMSLHPLKSGRNVIDRRCMAIGTENKQKVTVQITNLTTGKVYTGRLPITGNRQIYLPVEIQKRSGFRGNPHSDFGRISYNFQMSKCH